MEENKKKKREMKRKERRGRSGRKEAYEIEEEDKEETDESPCMGGSSFSFTVGGGGVKIDKGIFHCLRGSGGCPRWFVLFSKGFILQSKAYWNGLSFSISPVHKETRHKDDDFFPRVV